MCQKRLSLHTTQCCMQGKNATAPGSALVTVRLSESTRSIIQAYLAVDALVVVVEDEPAVVAELLFLRAHFLCNNLCGQPNDASEIVLCIEHLHKVHALS